MPTTKDINKYIGIIYYDKGFDGHFLIYRYNKDEEMYDEYCLEHPKEGFKNYRMEYSNFIVGLKDKDFIIKCGYNG